MQEFWSNSLAVGSKDWLEALAVYIPRNKRELSKVNFDSGYKITEDTSVYSLKTSKRS
jgi:hypothetical protein